MRNMKTLPLLFAALLPCLAAAPDAGKGKTMGNPSAPMTMELYSDFMCPHCKHLHEALLPAILLDYVNAGKACLIFREFPLAIDPSVLAEVQRDYDLGQKAHVNQTPTMVVTYKLTAAVDLLGRLQSVQELRE